MGSIFKTALGFLAPYRLAIYGLIFLVVAGFVGKLYFDWRAEQRQIGFDRALDKVTEQNNTAAKAAAKVRLTVEQCEDAGRSWNIHEGKCDE